MRLEGLGKVKRELHSPYLVSNLRPSYLYRSASAVLPGLPLWSLMSDVSMRNSLRLRALFLLEIMAPFRLVPDM
jgi:hypothetical protein